MVLEILKYFIVVICVVFALFQIGLVLNTGKDVKIMQGSASTVTVSKTSNLESMATRQVFGVMLLLVAMCFTGATAQAVFNSNYGVSDAWYLI